MFLSDGQLNHFFKDLALWDSSWGSGYYIAADTASYNFYPLRILFYTLMPNWLGFNLFIISAYVLASFFTFGYIKTITNNNYASFIGGLVFGFGGFMIAHLGHTSMIQAAAWMPLLIWSAEKLKNSTSKKWLVLYIISIVMMILSGHLQIFTYSILLLVLYVTLTGNTGSCKYKKYLLINMALLITAVSISIFQLYPTYELAQLGFRKALSFEEFNSYILSLDSLFLMFFPHLFGNPSFDSIKYFGNWYLTELTMYSGIISILIVLYLLSKKLLTDRLVQFWFFISIFSMLLALGDNIYWLSRLFYEIPIVNKFRALGRHAMEFSFSISVLVSMGITALYQNNDSYKMQRKYFIFVGVLGLCAILLAWNYYPVLIEIASHKNITLPKFINNPAIYWSVVCFIISMVTIWIFINKKSIYSKILLLIIFILNLGYFSYFSYWGDIFYQKNISIVNNDIKEIKQNTLANNTRILELEGSANKILNPMLSSLQGINTAGWYGPLITKNYSDTTGINTSGYTTPSIINNENLLGMLNIQYLFVKNATLNMKSKFTIGGQCGIKFNSSEEFDLKEYLDIEKVEIISSLACSTSIKQGEKVVDIVFTNYSGETKVLALYAGLDTSEWASECEDVKPSMQHELSSIHSTRKHKREGYSDCDIYDYTVTKDLSFKNVNKITFIWNQKINQGAININEVSILTKNDKVILSNFNQSSLTKMKKIKDASILENKNHMQKAWLVEKVTSMNEQDILQKIKTDQKFDYLSEALLTEVNQNSMHKQFDSNYNIRFESVKDGNIKMQVNSKSGAFLVLSESYHRGWKAYIDGIETKVHKTNNILNGIYVPQGGHIVEFNFFPTSFIYSLIYSLLVLVIFIVFIYRYKPYTRDKLNLYP